MCIRDRVNTLLKTPAAKRDVPIPKCLVACLKEAREKSESEYVISNSKGTVLTETQFVRVWKYITVRSTAERCYYTCLLYTSSRVLRTQEDWNEWQANTLGAAILMPQSEVDRAMWFINSRKPLTCYGWRYPEESACFPGKKNVLL